MKLSDFQLLTDENIDREVIEFLKSRGFDVERSGDVVGIGASDADILRFAFENKRLVLTHDRDFGALIFAARNAFYAILYLRPGHLSPAFTIGALTTLLTRDIELNPPVIIVCDRTDDEVVVRIRRPID